MTSSRLLKITLTSTALFALGVGCAKKAATTTSEAAENEFSEVAKVTGPVTTTRAASLAKASQNVMKLIEKGNDGLAATTGVSLASPGTFASGSSLPLCENVNLLKEILREAAGPDKILCYMAGMKSTGILPSTLDVADGNTHYIKLTNMPDSGGGSQEPRVKFRIVKTGDTITSFVMHSCFSGTAASPQQSEYISQTITNGSATVLTKNLGSQGSASYGSSMTTTGAFANGAWSSKNIAGFRYYSEGASSNVMTLNLDQFADSVQMAIAMKGGFSGDVFTNLFYTVAELLNGTSTLSSFALGDGSSKYTMSFDESSNGTGADFTQSGIISWNADNKSNLTTASDGDKYTSAAAGTLPSEPNPALTVSFSGDEAWNCDVPTGETFVESDFQTGGQSFVTHMNNCTDQYLGDGSWLQCPYQ